MNVLHLFGVYAGIIFALVLFRLLLFYEHGSALQQVLPCLGDDDDDERLPMQSLIAAIEAQRMLLSDLEAQLADKVEKRSERGERKG